MGANAGNYSPVTHKDVYVVDYLSPFLQLVDYGVLLDRRPLNKIKNDEVGTRTRR